MWPSAITSAPKLTTASTTRSPPFAYTCWPERSGLSMTSVDGAATGTSRITSVSTTSGITGASGDGAARRRRALRSGRRRVPPPSDARCRPLTATGTILCCASSAISASKSIVGGVFAQRRQVDRDRVPIEEVRHRRRSDRRARARARRDRWSSAPPRRAAARRSSDRRRRAHLHLLWRQQPSNSHSAKGREFNGHR